MIQGSTNAKTAFARNGDELVSYEIGEKREEWKKDKEGYRESRGNRENGKA